MTLAQVVDGVTDLDSALFNPIIDVVNNAGAGTYNVLDSSYGATGDGVADDTSAINAAMAAAFAANGGVVLLPAGTYVVSSQIKVPHQVVLKGRGRTATKIKAASNFPTSTALVRLGSDDNTLAFGTRVESMTLDCNAITGSIGVITDQAQEQAGLRDVLVSNYASYGFYAVDSAGDKFPQHFTLRDCEFYSHTSFTNPKGLYFEVVQSALLERLTVFNTSRNVSTGAGFEFNNSQVMAVELHAEYFADGALFYNGSGGMIAGMGGTHCTKLINVASNAGWFCCANVGMAGNNITAYLQDQINGQYFASPVAFHSCGATWLNGVRWTGYSTAASTPSTTELPETRSLGIHRNSNDSKVYLAYNDGGSIKKVELA